MAAAGRVAVKTAKTLEALFELLEKVAAEQAATQQELKALRKEVAALKATPPKKEGK